MVDVPAALRNFPTQQSALLARLEKWANISSHSRHLPGLQQMAAVLVAACQELTDDVRTLPVGTDGRVAVLARRRPAAPLRVLCSGHYDTVHLPDSPFRCQRSADATRLLGPGVADMKGGLVVLFAALAAYEASPAAETLGWEILLTPDEEIGSVDSQAWLEAAARRCHVGFVFEPARPSGNLVAQRLGIARYLLTGHGRAAHAAQPHDGRNAILALAESLLMLRDRTASIPGVLMNVGRIDGGEAANVVPDRARAELDVRCGTAAQAEAFATVLHACMDTINARDGYRLEASPQEARPPWAPTAVGATLVHAAEAAGRDLGLPPFTAEASGGGSDANLLQAAGLPCLDGLGPVGGRLHSDAEYIETRSLPERAALATLLLHRLASGVIAWPVA